MVSIYLFTPLRARMFALASSSAPIFVCFCADAGGCTNEQAAAGVLGYTQVSWDNKSGKEKQPSSSKKHWGDLTHSERVAAVALGYTGARWDKGGKKDEPASAEKYWAELNACQPATQPPGKGLVMCACILSFMSNSMCEHRAYQLCVFIHQLNRNWG